jgi:hypothetical protein
MTFATKTEKDSIPETWDAISYLPVVLVGRDLHMSLFPVADGR